MTVYLLTRQFHDDVKMALGKRWKEVRQLLRTLGQPDGEISDWFRKTPGKSIVVVVNMGSFSCKHR
jgi:hypothetical protein